MPIIQIHLMKGRDDTKKRKLVAAVTDAVCSSLEVDPKNVRIILSEMAPNDYSIAGELVMDQDNPFGKSK